MEIDLGMEMQHTRQGREMLSQQEGKKVGTKDYTVEL